MAPTFPLRTLISHAPRTVGRAWKMIGPALSTTLLMAFVLSFASGCTKIPEGRTSVDAVSIKGAEKVDGTDVLAKLATAPTPKFFWLFRGVVYEYELFDANVVSWDLARVERFYRAKGYYEAHARAGRIFRTEDRHVRVEIVVEEGGPTKVEDVRVTLDGTVPTAAVDALTRIKNSILGKGAILEEEKLTELQKALTRELEDRSFAKAGVSVKVEVEPAKHTALVLVDITAGPPFLFGKLTIEGLGELPRKKVRRTIDIVPGEPYSRSEIERAEQAMLDLGVVGQITIEPDFEHLDGNRLPHIVKIEPTKLRQIKLGGGVGVDALKTDVHLTARWEDRNFLGGMNQASVEFTPGVVLWPTRTSALDPPKKPLLQERLRLELRVPGAFSPRTTGFIRPEFNIFPSLVRTGKLDPDGERVLGYREVKMTAGVDRYFGKRLRFVLSHSVQLENPFPYIGFFPELGLTREGETELPKSQQLQTLLISYPELLLTYDLRDNATHPRKGIFLQNDLQVAGVGGAPRDIRIQPEARGYIPITKKLTFATRATLGFVKPFNYEASTDLRDVQIIFFRGFFSGGPTQNRGYAPRGISPRGYVPAFAPTLSAQDANRCTTGDTRPECQVSLGGLSLWEANAELRLELGGGFSTALFCDASNVSAKQFDVNIKRPHLSCGPGARLDTPVGPIRADFGVRIPGAQVLDDSEQEPAPNLLPGVPMTIQLGLGETF